MKKNILFILFFALASLLRGQTVVVQNAGNLCIGNHEQLKSFAYKKFKTQEMAFDTVHLYPNTAAFLNNDNMKLFISASNGPMASPSYTNLTSIYSHPFLYKGNSVSGRFNSDNLTDYAVINAFGDIVALKNTGFPLPFDKDSMPNSFIVGHTCSKLLKCDLDGAGYQDLVSFGVKMISTQSFVVRPYLNTTPASTAAPLSFAPQVIKTIGDMPSFTNYNFDVEAADLDNNGKDELVFASEVLDSIYVIYSLAGTLDKQFQFSPGPGFTHKKIVLSDLNGDGKKEITISGRINPSGVNYVALYSPIYLTGNLIGFNPFNSVFTNYEISDFNFADLNADGFKDLIVSQVTPSASTSAYISVYMHDRTSTNFQFSNTPINFPILNHITGGVSICDVDDNKRPDIISFPRTDTSSIVILKNFTFRDSLFSVPSKTAICVGDTILLKNQLIGFLGPYFTNIVPSLSVVASTNHTTSITSSGNFQVNASFNPYIGGTCTFTSNPLIIQQGLQLSINVTGPSTVCYNSPVTLSVGAGSYTWTTPSSTVYANSIQFTPTTSVAYVVTGSSTDGCRAVYNGTVNVKPDVNATITYDKNFLCKNQSANLTASGGITYSWSTGQTGAGIVITQTSTVAQIYNVYVTNADGCSKYAGFVTNYNDKCKEVIVIKGITPNSDGENDHLYIENIENYPDNVVSIYNRWGVQLYTQNGYNNSDKVWPSKTQNNLASGTYYYVIELGPGQEVKKGWIEIFSN